MKRAPLQLRTIVSLAMLLVSTLPVAGLAVWEQHNAVKTAMTAVKEKHLLLAKNLSYLLGIYVKDVRLVFTLAARNLGTSHAPSGLAETLRGLRVRSVRDVDRNGIVRHEICAFGCSGAGHIPAPVFSALSDARRRARKTPGHVIFSSVRRNARGMPTLFLLTARKDGHFIVGELEPDRLRDLQRSVSFGARGHAVIVDRRGRIIAHPYPERVAEMSSLSNLAVVQALMHGKAGVGT